MGSPVPVVNSSVPPTAGVCVAGKRPRSSTVTPTMRGLAAGIAAGVADPGRASAPLNRTHSRAVRQTVRGVALAWPVSVLGSELRSHLRIATQKHVGDLRRAAEPRPARASRPHLRSPRHRHLGPPQRRCASRVRPPAASPHSNSPGAMVTTARLDSPRPLPDEIKPAHDSVEAMTHPHRNRGVFMIAFTVGVQAKALTPAAAWKQDPRPVSDPVLGFRQSRVVCRRPARGGARALSFPRHPRPAPPLEHVDPAQSFRGSGGRAIATEIKQSCDTWRGWTIRTSPKDSPVALRA